MDRMEIERVIGMFPDKWQAYEEIKKSLRQSGLDWEEYQKKIRYAAERLGI